MKQGNVILLALVVPFLVLQIWVALRSPSSVGVLPSRPFEGLPFPSDAKESKGITSGTGGGIGPFPLWDDNGIPLQPLLDFITANATTTRWAKQRARFPEILYTVDSKGVHMSQTCRDRSWKKMIPYRLKPTEGIFRLAWKKLMNASDATNSSSSGSRWPTLQRVVQQESGFPFVVWYGDYKSCNLNNWNGKSIPLFTTCARVNCTHALPLPTYKTIRDSQATSSDWNTVLAKQAKQYPWESKTKKVVWRGSLSGPNNDFQSVRWRLAKLAHAERATDNNDNAGLLLLDIGLVSIPSRHDHLNLNLTQVGGLAKPIRPMSAFANYTAILDLDGNSWSSRFGALLCYNSVIFKVEPEYVDYFHVDLVPWEHYVPVKYDLSDLIEQAAFVKDPANRDGVQQIVANANSWCQQRMVWTSIAGDVLDIWEGYVKLLDLADSGWGRDWKQFKTSDNFESLFRMIQIQNKLDKNLYKR